MIDVTRWDATVDLTAATVELNADPRLTLEVREGARGLKPLTDKDRSEIHKNIDDKVLKGQPIAFRSTAARLSEAGGPLVVDGQLTMAGKTRSVTAQVDVDADGRVRGTIPLTQSDWGIKPYRGLMGALKVRDELEIALDARLQADRASANSRDARLVGASRCLTSPHPRRARERSARGLQLGATAAVAHDRALDVQPRRLAESDITRGSAMEATQRSIPQRRAARKEARRPAFAGDL